MDFGISNSIVTSVNPVGGSGKKEARDSACTPKWLAELIGDVDLDPCSNDRSHVRAGRTLCVEEGNDGLRREGKLGWEGGHLWQCVTHTAPASCRVFCNPPYANGQVIRWVRHYQHTRFIFLLRWDPSTRWFRELIGHCTHVWFPAKRINFEPPPGVKFSSNPFPHALYLRNPDPDLLDRLAPRGQILVPGRSAPPSARPGRRAP